MSGSQSPRSQAPSKAASPAINGWSAEYLDAQYEQFKRDPSSVSGDMAAFFQGFDLAAARPGSGGSGGDVCAGVSELQSAGEDLIGAYRALGHLIAKIDPFGRGRARPGALTIEKYGITQADLDKPVHTELAAGGAAPLRQVIERLEQAYCGSIGVEFMHIPSDDERAWFRRRFEGDLQPKGLDNAERVRLLQQLTAVEQFEAFLAKRFTQDIHGSLPLCGK